MSSCIPGRFLFLAHGNAVFLDRDSRIAARLSGPDSGRSSYCGYVFLDRPFWVGESLTIRIHAFRERSRSVFGFGMTSCDPRSVDVDSLPDDADLLFDRPEYWVIDRSNFLDLRPGDELDFRFTEGANGDGEIQCAKNDLKPVSVMFVDKTIPLWPFFELGNIAELKLLDASSYWPHSVNSIRNRPDLLNVDYDVISDGYLLQHLGGETGTSTKPQSQTTPRASTAKILPTSGRKPPAPPIPPRPVSKNKQPGQTKVPTALAVVAKGDNSRPGAPAKEANSRIATVSTGAATVPSNSSSTVKPSNAKTKKVAPPPPRPPLSSSSSSSLSRDNGVDRKRSSEEECLMCMERSVDCVLYTCGHMCLCFGCAADLKASANALCPVCRKEIADVIRTFRP